MGGRRGKDGIERDGLSMHFQYTAHPRDFQDLALAPVPPAPNVGIVAGEFDVRILSADDLGTAGHVDRFLAGLGLAPPMISTPTGTDFIIKSAAPRSAVPRPLRTTLAGTLWLDGVHALVEPSIVGGWRFQLSPGDLRYVSLTDLRPILGKPVLESPHLLGGTVEARWRAHVAHVKDQPGYALTPALYQLWSHARILDMSPTAAALAVGKLRGRSAKWTLGDARRCYRKMDADHAWIGRLPRPADPRQAAVFEACLSTLARNGPGYMIHRAEILRVLSPRKPPIYTPGGKGGEKDRDPEHPIYTPGGRGGGKNRWHPTVWTVRAALGDLVEAGFLHLGSRTVRGRRYRGYFLVPQ